MKQYFKDYKAKMLKEEAEIQQQQSSAIFKNEVLDERNKGTFLKKKITGEKESSQTSESKGFLFNFKDPSVEEDVSKVSEKVSSIKLS
jgi:hypothetical protein